MRLLPSLLCFSLLSSITSAQQVNQLVSLTPGGQTGAGSSGFTNALAISADGRFVAFDSYADDLVPGDTGLVDIFVRDMLLGTTERISVDDGGVAANGDSYAPSISDDGRFVVFSSAAGNLHPGVPAFGVQVYLRDRLAGTTRLISTAPGGDGGNGWSEDAQISADGAFVLFTSSAGNLVPGDTNFVEDLFLVEVAGGAIERASVGDAGQQSPQSSDPGSLSGDGRFVLFASYWDPLIAGDLNGAPDLLLYDRTLGVSSRIALPAPGLAPGDNLLQVQLSDDAQTLAFVSDADGLVASDHNGRDDVFAMDLAGGALELISRATAFTPADDDSSWPRLSADGRWVVFQSRAGTLWTKDNNHEPDVFAHDRLLGETLRVSLRDSGHAAWEASASADISADGRYVAYGSWTDGLVPGDANGEKDVFRHDLAIAPPQVYCTGKLSSQLCQPTIGWSGSTSLAAGAPLRVRGNEIEPGVLGTLLYGTAQQVTPFQNGLLCVAGSLTRTPLQLSGTPDQSPCTGTFSFDFTDWYLSGADPALVLGASVYAQYWFRDPLEPYFHSGLTDALRFVLRP